MDTEIEAPAARRVPVGVAARRLNMSRERVMRRLFDGRISGELVFGRWMVLESSIEAYRERQVRGAA